MKLIRSLSGLLALMTLILSLAGCTPRKPPTFRIGVALYSQEDTFIASVAQELNRLAKEEEQTQGIKLNLSMVDAGRSQSVQNEQVDRFLNQGYDVICVNIVDRTAAAVIVDKAQRANVPVIFFNREPVQEDLDRWEHAYYVGARGEQAGRMQGQIVLENWREHRRELDLNSDGVLQYVMLEGEPGHQDTLLRSEYSVKTLQTNGVQLERLGNYSADWQRGKAGVKMSQWLEEYPGRIEAVLSNNDDMALGALDAWAAAGLQEPLPLIVGVDATEESEEAIRQGSMTGTVRNDFRGQAGKIMALASTLLAQDEPEETLEIEEDHYIWLEYSPVTAETLRLEES